jgi:hypothetical protein
MVSVNDTDIVNCVPLIMLTKTLNFFARFDGSFAVFRAPLALPSRLPAADDNDEPPPCGLLGGMLLDSVHCSSM